MVIPKKKIFSSLRDSASFRELLLNRKFIHLWISQICSQFSIRMVTLALILNVFQATKSNILVVLLIFAFALPALIFGLPAGAYVDKHSRKNVLIITNLFQSFLMFLFLFSRSNIFLTLFIIFIYATINQLYIPAESSMIPNLVPEKNLLSANSLFMFTVYGSYIFGYGAAGPLMLLLGNNSPFILGGILLFIAFLSCLFLPAEEKRIKEKISFKKVYSKVIKEAKEAYIFIKNKKSVSQSIWRLTIVQAIIGALAVLIPAYSDRVLKMDVRTASIIFITPVGLGTVLGALLISKIGHKINIHHLIKRIIISDGITIGLMGAIYPIGKHIKDLFNLTFLSYKSLLWLIGFLVLILGMENAMIIVGAQTEIQKSTPYNIRGRVFGIFGIIVTIMALWPMFFMGALADIFSVTTVFILGGILMILYGIFTQEYIQ